MKCYPLAVASCDKDRSPLLSLRAEKLVWYLPPPVVDRAAEPLLQLCSPRKLSAIMSPLHTLTLFKHTQVFTFQLVKMKNRQQPHL